MGLLAWAVAGVGVRTAIAQLRTLGPLLPPVLVINAVRYIAQAAAWRVAVPLGSRPPLWRLVTACLTGEAFGYLTFAGPLASVPARALLVRDRVPLREGAAAAALERVVFILTAAAMVVAAVVLVAHHRIAEGATGWPIVASIASAVIVGVVAVAAIFAVASRRWLPSCPLSASVLTRLVCLAAAQHAIALVEATIMLRAVGAPAAFRRVFVFEALMRLVGVPAAFVPAGIGVYESGSTVLAEVLHLGAASGLSLGLMRRVRALIFSAIGLLTLVLHRAARTDAGPGNTPARTGP